MTAPKAQAVAMGDLLGDLVKIYRVYDGMIPEVVY